MPVQPVKEGCTNRAAIDLLLAMSGYVVASRSRRAAGSSSPRFAGNRMTRSEIPWPEQSRSAQGVARLRRSLGWRSCLGLVEKQLSRFCSVDVELGEAWLMKP